jgi:hypothetical protein
VSQDAYVFLKAYNNKLVFFVKALIIFLFVCFLADEEIKLTVLACSLKITNFENPSSDPLQRA